MNSRKVTAVARIKAKPGMQARVKEELQKLLAPTRSEKGCINYDMHQALDQEAHFLFLENWTSREPLDKHLVTPHIKNFVNQEV